MKNKFLWIFFLLLVLAIDSFGQCVMCKSVSESSGQGYNINSAILYMAFFPYLLLSVLGYIWYRNYKKSKNAKKNKTSGYTAM
jgi:hypothetical protein